VGGNRNGGGSGSENENNARRESKTAGVGRVMRRKR